MGFTVMESFMDRWSCAARRERAPPCACTSASSRGTRPFRAARERAALPKQRRPDKLARAQSGDQQAREALVKENLALVKFIVKRFAGRGAEYDDLYQYGCLGLLKAVDRFDPNYPVRFSTYAVPVIMGEIRRYLRDDGPIHVSRTIHERARRIGAFMQDYEAEHGFSPSVDEIASALGMESGDVLLALNSRGRVRSLNEPVGGEGDLRLMDVVGTEPMARGGRAPDAFKAAQGPDRRGAHADRPALLQIPHPDPDRPGHGHLPGAGLPHGEPHPQAHAGAWPGRTTKKDRSPYRLRSVICRFRLTPRRLRCRRSRRWRSNPSRSRRGGSCRRCRPRAAGSPRS